MGQNEKVGGIEFEAGIDLAKFQADTQKLRELLEKMNPSLKNVEKGLKDVEQSGRGAGDAADKAGLSFKNLFGAFTLGNIASRLITAAIRDIKDAFVNAIKGAIDFQAEMTQVRKVTGATKSEIAGLKKYLSDLSVETGIAKSELAGIATAGGRLGIFSREGAKGLQDFTHVIALSRVAMEDFAGSSDEAADKTARLLNLFGLDAKDSEVMLSIMNELSNTAAATSSNIADNVTNFASLSQTFGASKESLLALAATMEEVGSEPEAFSTGFQTALFEMQKHTDKFAAFLGSEMGPKFKETFAKEPVEAFAIFLNGLRQTGRDIGTVLENLGIGDRRLTRELAKLATDKGLQRFAENLQTAKDASKEAQDAVDGLGGSASSLEKEFERASDTTKKRLSSLGEEVSNVGNAFGEKLQPALDVVNEGLTVGLEKSLPVISAIGESIGGLIESTLVLGASLKDAVSGFINFSAGALRKPFEMVGVAEKGAADELMKYGLFGQDSAEKLAQRFADAHTIIEEQSKKRGTGAPIPTFTGGGAPDMSAAAADSQKTKEQTDQEKELEKMQKDIDEASVKALKQRRETLKEYLQAQKDSVGLSEREERIWKRLGDDAGSAFDVRRATNFKDLLSSLSDQTEELQGDFNNVTKEVDRLEKDLQSMTEDSKKRIQDLTQEAQDLQDEFQSKFGAKGSERIDLAKNIAEQLVEARKTIDELGGKSNLEQADMDKLLEAQKVFQEGQKFLEGGSSFDPKVLEFVKQLDQLSNAKDVFEQLQIQFDQNKAQAEADLKEKEHEIDMSKALEQAFQENRLEEFLKANDSELTAAQKRHAEELQDQKRKLETELSLNRQLQLDITNALVAQVAIRNEAQEAFKNAEISRFDAIKQKALEAISAIHAAEEASKSVGAGYARGGMVYGPGGSTDDLVPAWLSSGEFVVKAAAVRLNRPLLEAINSQRFSMPRFSEGGAVTTNTNNARSLKLTQNFYGEAANAMGSPRMVRWHARKAL